MPTVEQNLFSFLSGFLFKGRGVIHMLGISGVGMAGLAFHLKKLGFDVSGCDVKSGEPAVWLAGRGISVLEGHGFSHLQDGADLVIRSSAVPEDCEELKFAEAAGIPVARRGEVLSLLLKSHGSVAVAGTHGKTTTSSFIAQILRSSGVPLSWCIGGWTSSLGGLAGYDRDAHVFVAEADESDGTLELYSPDIGVVANIEFDHMENFADAGAFRVCFASFVRRCSRVVYCADSPGADEICRDHELSRSYGFSEHAFYRAVDIDSAGLASSFTLFCGGRESCRVELPLPGRHNVLNLLAAIAVSAWTGVDTGAIVDAVGSLELPARRFERVVDNERIMVISDYAHHPSEISALVGSVAEAPFCRRGLRHRRIVAVFQPHRYSRTLALGKDFPRAFEGVDQAVLAPVYAASEKPVPGGRIADLYERFRKTRPGLECILGQSLEEIKGYLAANLQCGDILLVVGAGDVVEIARWARECEQSGVYPFGSGPVAAEDESRRKAEELRADLSRQSVLRVDEPAGRKTTLGVGGSADLWADVADEPDLCRLVSHCSAANMPWRVIGAGSNVVVPDSGVRGVVLRLVGADFKHMRRNENTIVAGAGVPLAALLDCLEDEGSAGMEFMHGIPGTVGGALRMNAGAWGSEIADCVQWVRYCDYSGRICRAGREDLGFSYRNCSGLKDAVAVEACFNISAGNRREISRNRREIAEKRAWMKGMRSAGSVFKNPPGNYAGKLLEQVGMKGRSVGGAAFSMQHANFITLQPSATASDVIALMEKAREEVALRFKVRLKKEIVCWS
ncbi:MAG: UDP-N-acetylmuramate--L-alanine ligase [Verrucomicrobiota bacterium]